MEQDAQAAVPEAEAAAPPKKSGRLMLKLAVAVVVLSVAGGGAWWFLAGDTEAAAGAEAPAPPLESRGLVSFEPFLVNLADPGGSRFLKLTAQLVVADEAQAKHLQEKEVVRMQLRSSILELLTQQSAAELVTADGKAALKAAIKARVSTLLEHQQVIDVLFSEFVVQF